MLIIGLLIAVQTLANIATAMAWRNQVRFNRTMVNGWKDQQKLNVVNRDAFQKIADKIG